MTQKDLDVIGACTINEDRRLVHQAADMARMLSHLVQRESISGREQDAVAYLRQWFDARNWHVTVQRLDQSTPYQEGVLHSSEVQGGRANLIVRPWIPAAGRRSLTINGHVDVVPPGPTDTWDRNPFSGDIEGGFVHGRGTVDTQGAVVSAIFALEELRQSGQRPIDVALVLTVGEETSGAGTLASFDVVTSQDAVIVLEPTGNRVAPVSSGLLFLTIEVNGVSAHTSAPWRGKDAFRQLIDIHTALVALNEDRAQRYRSPLFAHVPTPIPFVMGVIQAGEWRAAVPSTAKMSGRWGILPGEDPDVALRMIDNLVTEVDSRNDWSIPSRAHLERTVHGWQTEDTHPLARIMQQSCATAVPDSTPLGLTAGSDAAFYGSRNIPTVVFGPGDLALAHSPNERIAITEMVTGAAILKQTIEALGCAQWNEGS